MESNAQVVEAVVAKTGDLKNGEMREVALGEAGKVLLIKENNEFKAIGNKCTHYGAPLKDGVLCNGRVRCPWHGACFNTSTGDIEDSPGLDSVHTFKVRVEGDDVIVSAPAEQVGQAWKRAPRINACSSDSADSRLFVIIGAGAAGSAAAETLRDEGFGGRIVVVSKERHLPYDRIKLSKAMSASPESIQLRSEAFYAERNIELLLGEEVTELDPAEKSVALASGQRFTYDGCLVATGGSPRRLTVPGADLDGVFCLRVPEEANAIAASVEGKNLVVIGSSFIGMEVAAALVGKAKSVTVVGLEKVPFERVLGTQVGGLLQSLHESKGVKFCLSASTKEFRGEGGVVRGVVLGDGTELEADLVVVGVGVTLPTGFIKSTVEGGLVDLARDGSLVVDPHLRVAEGLWAAGDVARYPYHLTGEAVRVEHWGMAQTQGRAAARDFVAQAQGSRARQFDVVPFFWTVQFGKSVRYAGHATSFDDVVLVQPDAAADPLKFVAYFGRQGKVLAVAALGMDPMVSAAADLLAHNKMPLMSELKANGGADLKALL